MTILVSSMTTQEKGFGNDPAYIKIPDTIRGFLCVMLIKRKNTH